ncbi:MAG: hypothetical protein H6R18_3063 [Proteobacteria bacterium]|nr:hypothetical protein [Pseudomonadota bacterium]
MPADNYFNQQLVGDCVLCYRVLATEGNAAQIARYLDGRIPAAYSDLENVYNQIDSLWSVPLAPALNQALNQISPARYDALTTQSLRLGVLYNEVASQSLYARLQEEEGEPSSRLLFAGPVTVLPESDKTSGRRVWGQVVGANFRDGNAGFDARASGIFFGTDQRLSSSSLLGFSAGLMRSRLDWRDAGGQAEIQSAKAGVHFLWSEANWFVQGGANLGVSQADTRRNIAFGQISRIASASTKGWEGNIRLETGYRLPLENVRLVPTISLDTFHFHRRAFAETGADSLNLRVQAVSNHSLRSVAAIHLSWDSKLRNGQLLTPFLQLGWAHERSLDGRVITAALQGEADGFTVQGNTRRRNALLFSTGASLVSGRNLSVFARYQLEHSPNSSGQLLSAGLHYRF